MGTITASQTTAKIVYRLPFAPDSSQPVGQPLIMVVADVNYNIASADAYVAGGIPIDLLFTSGDASDTRLDTAQPIIHVNEMCALRYDTTQDKVLFGKLKQTSAGVMTLEMFYIPADGGSNPTSAIEVTDAADISGATAFNGNANDVTFRLVLVGRLRYGQNL